MREFTRHHDRSETAVADELAPLHPQTAGKATLTDGLYRGSRPVPAPVREERGESAARPMFDAGVAWEAIDPGEYAPEREDEDGEGEADAAREAAHEAAQLAHLDAASGDSDELQAEHGLGASPEATDADAGASLAAPEPASLEEGGDELLVAEPDGERDGDAEVDEVDEIDEIDEVDEVDEVDGALEAARAHGLEAGRDDDLEAGRDDDLEADRGAAAARQLRAASASAAAASATTAQATQDDRDKSISRSKPKSKSKPKPKPKAKPRALAVRGERTTQRAYKDYFAKRDRFNKRSVTSNRLSKHERVRKNQIHRPGVRVANRDSFQLAQSPANRYKIATGNVAEQIDVVTAEYLKPTPNAPKGHRMALNPAHSRVLKLPDGTSELCVFVWVGSRGAGWMPVRFIRTGKGFSHDDIKDQVDRRSAQWGPAKASGKQMKSARRYVFIDGDAPGASAADQHAIAHPRRDRKTFILTRQQSGLGNHTSDYLQHVGIRDGRRGRRDFINLCMNLPSEGTPPVAIDTTRPGDVFFLPEGRDFRREIAIYQLRGSRSRRRQTWVYGMVGKQDAQGRWQPDDKRRGWVPLRTVKKA